MKISVIVPVYNVEQYLEQCLTSIMRQTYSDLEIILVNDGSTDQSARICEEFAAKDSRFIVIHQPNGGVSVARNTGVEEATGEYLTFVDSDDWLELEMYESMVSQIKEIPVLDMVMCDSTLIKSNSQIKNTESIRDGYYSKSEIISDLYPVLLVTEQFGKIPIVSIWNCVIRRKILIENHIRFEPSLRYSEDYLFMANVMVHTNSYYYLKGEHFYNYRQYAESRSKMFQASWWSNFLDLNKKLNDLLADSKEYDFSRQLKLQLIHSALFFSSAILNNETFNSIEKLRLFRKLFKQPELKGAFINLDFKNRPLGLKISLYLVKSNNAIGYWVFSKLLSYLKS